MVRFDEIKTSRLLIQKIRCDIQGYIQNILLTMYTEATRVVRSAARPEYMA